MTTKWIRAATRISLGAAAVFYAVCLAPGRLDAGERLPNTEPLALPADLVKSQFDQIVRYWQRRIEEATSDRDRTWQADFTSTDAYEKSLAPRRDDCRRMLGLTADGDRAGEASAEKLVAFAGDVAFRVAIPLQAGMTARGILFMPAGEGKRQAMVVCPDADQWPEQFTGLEHGQASPWLAELLAQGVTVYVPQSIERLADHAYCKHLGGKDRRTILYRLGYVVGRSMPGLDVQDVLVAVDYLCQRDDVDSKRVAVIGHGQGGMTALFAAGLDRRVASAAVVDYFGSRDRCWAEPVDRRLSGQLLHAADAELAALTAPRKLAIFHSPRFDEASAGLEREVGRGLPFYDGLGRKNSISVKPLAEQDEWPLRAAAELGIAKKDGKSKQGDGAIEPIAGAAWRDRHFEERLGHLRGLIDASASERNDRWKLLLRPAADFAEIQTAMRAEYRRLAGAVPRENVPLEPRSDLIAETDKFKAYHVLLRVTAEVEAYGQLLVPKGVKGRTAAVICQHGLSGTPAMITGVGHAEDTPYHQFGRRLAERGYVVFAPLVLHYHPVELTNQQARMADAVGAMRISLVAAQAERVVDFLASLPMVDSNRIGYYGLSYGGYSAIWVTPLVDRLAAIVISGHFNDWRAKIASDQLRTSYLFHPDEDFYNWNVLPRFAHPELLALNFPKPICIEFGRRDGITTPEWTMAAWKEVVALREHLRLEPERITLTEFDGPHEVHGVETFEFLERWLGEREE